jgi:hypothetical protein
MHFFPCCGSLPLDTSLRALVAAPGRLESGKGFNPGWHAITDYGRLWQRMVHLTVMLLTPFRWYHDVS